jgi:hypothetical protein
MALAPPDRDAQVVQLRERMFATAAERLDCARHRWTKRRATDASREGRLADQATSAEPVFMVRSITQASESNAGAIFSFGTQA